MDIQSLELFGAVFSFALGAIIGSFLTVCVYRMPKGLSISKPRRSFCPKCEKMVAWYDNIPILSWLILGARCRNCRAPISWIYPCIECTTALLFLLIFWRFGLTLATPVYMVLSAGFVLVIFIDLTDWTIPNEVTLTGIPVGIACALVAMFYTASGLHVEGPMEPIFNSLIGVVAGGLPLYLIDKFALLVLKKPGMGFGDVKLNAMIGAFFGWPSALLTIFIACVVGSVVGVTAILFAGRQTEVTAGDDEDAPTGHYIPFGPFLVFGGIIVMLFGQPIYHFLLRYWGIA